MSLQIGSFPIYWVPGTALSRKTLSGNHTCVVVELTMETRSVKLKAQPSHFMGEEAGAGRDEGTCPMSWMEGTAGCTIRFLRLCFL